MSTSGRGRLVALGCAVVGAALLLAAAVGLVRRSESTSAAAASPTAAPTLPAASGRLPVSSRPMASAPPAVPPARGARLQLPRLHVDAPIDHVGLAGRVMQVPPDPRRVGWWSGGVAPGADRGSAVLVGHVDYAGTPGALGVLPRARPGDVVRLVRPDETFRVAAVRSYPKSSGLPATVFSRTGPAQLVLITCGGSFDAATGNYRDNVVVYAQRI